MSSNGCSGPGWLWHVLMACMYAEQRPALQCACRCHVLHELQHSMRCVRASGQVTRALNTCFCMIQQTRVISVPCAAAL